jgi:hypothetical protein
MKACAAMGAADYTGKFRLYRKSDWATQHLLTKIESRGKATAARGAGPSTHSTMDNSENADADTWLPRRTASLSRAKKFLSRYPIS